MKNSGLAIFASGRGSNAQKIIDHFKKEGLKITCIVSNNINAGILDLARDYEIPQIVLEKGNFYGSEELLGQLQKYEVNFIALAGFLWLIPRYLILSFKDRILNIHPALLPKFGGKGMYGSKVHKAVKQSKETKSGLTIHLVNEEYDKGEILFQASCAIKIEDTPEDIAGKVLELEHRFYPVVLSSFIEFQS